MNRIYIRENHDAYVIISSHIIHFSRGRRDECVRIVKDKSTNGAYFGSDGYRYQVGETVILKYHPLTKDRVFFDADDAYQIPSSWLGMISGIEAIIAPRGRLISWMKPTETHPEGIIEDYVDDVLIVDDDLFVTTQCGYKYRVSEISG